MYGSLENDCLLYCEEEMTPNDLKLAIRFLTWLREHNLTVGHGTIGIRWDEFRHNKTPISKDAAYGIAMRIAETKFGRFT